MSNKDLNYDSKGVKDYFAHGSGSAGGVLVGKRHSEGGIKAINKSTGQPLEMEGGEVVITRKAVSDDKKREFEGEMLTNREILSRINQSGGGVKIFSEGGDIESHTCSCSGKSYKYGGKMMSDYEIAHHLSKYDNQTDFSQLSHKSYEVGGVLDLNKLNPTEMYILHKLDKNIHSKCDIHRNKLDDIKHIQDLGMVYATQTKDHSCYHVRLTDYGMEVLENMDIPDGHFAKGGSMADCGCGKSYADGGIINSLWEKIRNASKNIYKSTDYEGYDNVVYLSSNNKINIGNYSNLTPYSAQAYESRKYKVSFMKDDTMITFTNEVKERKEDRNSYEKYKGIIYIYEPINDEVSEEIIKKVDLFKNHDNAVGVDTETQYKYFKGIDAKYKNQFEINKAIEELVDSIPADKITPEEKAFIGYYAGYGGLEKYGATGKGIKYEFFTPSEISRKMWGLAYKYGFNGGYILEPACGIGEFFKYAPDQSMITGYDINDKIIKICKILYPQATLYNKSFETLFVKNNKSIRGSVEGLKKYSLVIGNPPYGSYNSPLAGIGEKDYTDSNNFIDYFIFRGLDLLEKDGLLIYIIGTEVAVGGTPFLAQPINKVKKSILEKSELLDAYRLPNGLFSNTDVVTDIIVLRKK